MPDRARREQVKDPLFTLSMLTTARKRRPVRDNRGSRGRSLRFLPSNIDKCPSVRNVRSAAARHKLKLPRLFAHLLACARRLAHLTYHQPSLVHIPPNFPFLPRLRSAHPSIACTSNAPELYLNRKCPKPKQNQKTSSMVQSRIHCGSAAVLAALPPAPHILSI